MANDHLKQRQHTTTTAQKDNETPQLPHEHDESAASQTSAQRDEVQQAYHDIESGQVDTDLRGTRGVEAVKQPVPAPTQESAGEKFGTPEADKSDNSKK